MEFDKERSTLYIQTMSENGVGEITPKEHRDAHAKATKIAEKLGPRIGNTDTPVGQAERRLAQFNLNVPGAVEQPNAPWQPRSHNILGEPLNPAPEANPSAEIIQDLHSPKRILVPNESPERIEAKDWDSLPDDDQTEKGQRLNVLTANWDKKDSGKPVNMFFGNYTNAHGVGESNERLVQLAHQMPDNALLAIDHPQFGDSDKMTREQRREGFMKVVESELRVMKKLGVKEVNLMGQSMGAYTVLSMALAAEKYGIKVKNLILEEIPGVDEMSALGLGKRTLGENSKLDVYHALPEDPRMIKAAGMLKSPPARLKDLVTGLVKLPTKFDPFLRYGRALAKGDTKEKAVELAWSRQIDNIDQIVFMNGSESTVSSEKGIKDIVDGLREIMKVKSAVKGEEKKEKIRRIIFPGFGHLATVNARVHAANVKLILEGSALSASAA
jgi:pimeloyl-ACP methyl ester carboxylesterase